MNTDIVANGVTTESFEIETYTVFKFRINQLHAHQKWLQPEKNKRNFAIKRNYSTPFNG